MERIMKTIKKHLNKVYLLAVGLLLPIQAFAVYKPLAGKIPGLPYGDADFSLSQYINALFKIAMMLGVILSVLIIAYSGFEYMTIDVAMKKGAAKVRIRRALTGLLMLLATYLVFKQINPEILELKVF